MAWAAAVADTPASNKVTGLSGEVMIIIIICVQQALFEEFDRLLLTDSPPPQLLSYDTTFKLGDFYLSTLAFCHILLTQSPVIPLCFLIHDRKFQSSHDVFAIDFPLYC